MIKQVPHHSGYVAFQFVLVDAAPTVFVWQQIYVPVIMDSLVKIVKFLIQVNKCCCWFVLPKGR